MKNINDLTGQKFNRLTVIEKTNIRKNRQIVYKCKCDCGNYKNIPSGYLKNGSVKSCGCLQKEMASKSNKTHGESKTKLYSIWKDMRRRCNSKNHHAYKYYGGKGVSVCNEWNNNFENFKEWSLSNGYENGLTIDRIYNNKNYEPSNCRWVTMLVQCNNRNNNIKINFMNEEYSLNLFLKKYNLSAYTFRKYTNSSKNINDITLCTALKASYDSPSGKCILDEKTLKFIDYILN